VSPTSVLIFNQISLSSHDYSTDMSRVKFCEKYPTSKAVCIAEQGKISPDWFNAGQKLNMKNLCFSCMQHGLH
jgi:hypothetical protein